MANVESPYQSDTVRQNENNDCEGACDGTISICATEHDKSCTKVGGADLSVIAKSHGTSPEEMFPHSEVKTARSAKNEVHDLPIIQVNLAETESKSSPQENSRQLNLEESSLLDGVGDLERNCGSVRNSLPEPFLMSVSPTASIFNYLSSVPSPIDKAHMDGLLIDQTMSPSSPSVDSIIHDHNQNSLQNKTSQLDSVRVKTGLDSFKTIDAYIGSSCLPDLSEFSSAKSARTVPSKGKLFLVKPTPYPLTNPGKQKADKIQEMNRESFKSHCSNSIYSEHIQNMYETNQESRPSCRFEKRKTQSVSEREGCTIPGRTDQSKVPADIPEIGSSTATLSFLDQSATCGGGNVESKQTKAAEAKSDFRKNPQTPSQTHASSPRSPSSPCSSFFTKNTFLIPTSSSSFADKSASSLVNITDHPAFPSNTLPILCRDDFSCSKNVSNMSKLSAPYVSKGGEYNDKDGLSQYLCGDESTLKGDLPCSLYYSGNGNINCSAVVVNRNMTSRRHSSVSSATSSTSKRSNSGSSFSDQHFIGLSNARRESSHSDISTEFQTSQICSEAAQKRLSSPPTCEFGLEAASLSSQGYLSCSLGPTGAEAGDACGTMLDSNSPLLTQVSASSCLYNSNFTNTRGRKDEVTVPADITAWTAEHVQIWLRWTVSQYALTDVDTGHFEGMDGA
ncbi:hypothetical protein EGW08_022677, partial [Elysia chlorotica]